MWSDKLPTEDGMYWVCKLNFEPVPAKLFTKYKWCWEVESYELTHEEFLEYGYHVGPKLTPPAKRTV